MSTLATANLKSLAKGWEDECGLNSAVLSGIVGDLAHKIRGGYHISRMDQPSTNYSVVRPDDKSGNGPNDAAAAIDMTMSTADMKTATYRLISVYNNKSDGRRNYINAFNGWTGSGDAQRWDIYGNKQEFATADHKWHVHIEVRRRFVNDPAAMAAILSILKGEGQPQSGGYPGYPGRILRRNDAQTSPDSALKLWVGRMLERGWTSFGTNDGYFGPKVESGVKRFQEHVGVSADGMIGPQTWPLPWTDPLG